MTRPRLFRKILPALLLLPALVAGALAQTTVVFRQGLNGYAGTTDTMLQQGAPTTAAGSGPTMDVVGGTAARQSLVKFANIIGTATNQIPPNAQILSATLELSVWTAGSGIAVHRMNKAWTETATWNSMGNGLQIGDEEAHWSAVDTKTNLPRGLATFDVATTVQEWANAAEVNEGWALLPPDGATTAVQVDTRESTFTTGKTWEIKPTLRVTYSGGGGGGTPPTINPVSPADGAANVGSGGSVPLEVSLADADNQPLAVTFYGREKTTASVNAGEDFTLVMIPDTQFYSENGSRGKITDFRNMTTWMVNNRQALNIQFVAHMGDMVQNRDDSEQEWINADSAMKIIENAQTTGLIHGIPWGGAPGNHDQNRSGGANRFWNQYFGNSRWSGKTYYRGGYNDGTSDANYQFFSASGMDFIVINMEYRANAAMIAWADALIKANPTRRAIVTSHEILQAYLDAGTPVDQAPYYGQGRAIYEGLRNNPNFFLMLCGHWHGEGRRTEIWQGRKIHAVLCNYQTEANGGDTWLRYLVFSPKNNTITSNVIRTRDGARRTTNVSQFTLEYNMSDTAPQWTALGTVNRPAGSTSATVNWTGLQTGKSYEWYAAVSDGGSPVSTAPRTFTVGNNTAPTVALTAPANGATIVRPAKVELAATASDADGTVTRVEFFQGTTKVGEDSTAPYTFSWDAAAGSYSLTAQAIDNGGARTTSAARTVTVTGSGGGGDPQAPTISPSYPAAASTGAGGSGRVTLQAAVADANNDPLNVTFYGRPKATSGGGGDFTLAVMPDTQYYTDNNGQYINNWRAQANWIVTNRATENIAYVAHVGDVTQLFDSQEYEWVLADGVMKIIENPVTTLLQHGVSWGAVPGNHDLNSSGNRGSNDYYNKYFGPKRFAGRPYFGGGITANDNHCSYTLFSAGGLDFVVVNLRHRPTDTMISWGDSILKQFPNRRGIVTSHEIINDNGAGWTGQGQAIFDGLKNNPNLFLMLCGHKHEATGENRRSDVVSGRTIHTIVQDYQDRSAGGGAWFRLYKFSPANNTISARTVQATTGNFETDANSQFTISYNMSGSGGGGTPAPWTTLGTVSLPAGAPTAYLDWTGLTAGTEYEWYAAVSDGGTPVSTSARSFTLANNTAPTVSLDGPANGATINLPATVNFTATATDSGSVARVEFFAGAFKVGEDTTSPYSFNWSAPAGSHVLTAVAVDGIGARTVSSARTVTVTNANNPPTVALTAPANGASIPLPGPVEIAATASDSDGTVTKVAFFHGSTLIAEDTSEPYSVSWSAPPGTHTLTAVATDNSGNQTTSASRTITVTNQAPTVVISQPSSGESFRLGNSIAIRATPEDADGSIAKVEYFAGNVRLGQRSASPWQFTWSDAPLGTHILTVVAEDNFGQKTTSAPVTISVTGNASPTVALTAPAPGATIALPAAVEITATAADTDGSVAKVAFFQNGVLLGEDTSTPYSFTWDAPPGSHVLTAIATDNNGANTTSAPVSITVTNQPPTVTLTAPADGAQITLPASLLVTADAADPDTGLAKVRFYAGATLLAEDTEAPYQTLWSPVPGTHPIRAQAVDIHGATADSAVATITVVNPPPVAAISFPADGATLELPGPLNVSVSAEDDSSSVAKVTLMVDGSPVSEKSGPPFDFPWTPVTGAYTLTAVAEDNFGATTTTAPVAVTVANPDNLRPAVSLTSPAAGASVNLGAPVTVAAAASDSDGVITKVEFYRGLTKIGTRTQAPYQLTWTPGVPGPVVLTAVAYDNDGATTTSAAVPLTVTASTAASVVWVGDTLAPTITGPLTAADAAAGSGLTNFNANPTFRNISANGWSNSYAASNSGNDYFEFALTAAGSSPFLIRSVGFNHWSSSSTNPHYFRVFYSFDNFATRIQLGGTSPTPANATDGRLTISTAPEPFTAHRKIVVPAGATLKFRIYAWAGSTGTYLRIDNFAVNGVTRPILRRLDFEPGESGLTLAGGQFFEGNTASTDRPAAAPQAVQGTRAYGVTAGTATITSGPIDTRQGSDLTLAFRLAALAVGSATEGLDAGDKVTVALSPDGGSTWQDVLHVTGNANAYHSFGSGLGTATAAFAPTADPVTSAPAGGGSRTTEGTNNRTDGFSTVEITDLPAVEDLRFRITMANDSAGERWLVDDIVVAGFVPEAEARPSVTILATSSALASEFGPDRSLVFRVTRAGPALGELGVQLDHTGSATPGADFTGFSQQLTIPDTSAGADLVLTVLPDTAAEGPESVRISLAPDPAYDIGEPAMAEATILDHPYDDWRHQHGLGDDAAASRLAYLFGRLPGSPGPATVLEIREPLQAAFRFRFPKAKNAPAVAHRILWSRDLADWHSSGETADGITVTIGEVRVSAENADPETIEATATVEPAALPGRLFFRIEATLQR